MLSKRRPHPTGTEEPDDPQGEGRGGEDRGAVDGGRSGEWRGAEDGGRSGEESGAGDGGQPSCPR